MTGNEVGVRPTQDVAVVVEPSPVLKNEFPEELQFLLSEACNPDLKDPKNREQGFIRAKAVDPDEEEVRPKKKCDAPRIICGLIVYSITVQTLVAIVIIIDVTCTIIEFSDKDLPDDWALFVLTDWLSVIVLSADVGARFFVEGSDFLRSCMNIFELILVPMTVAEVFLLKNSSLPVPLLRALRPCLRVLRVIRILVRTAGKGRDYLIHIKHTVSGDRVRFQQDGFDLDLAYIGAQLIAMPVPGTGLESMFFNSHQDVARFLNERHSNRYLLLNTTEDQRYPTKPFFNRTLQFPMAQDSVPAIDKLFDLCQILDEFLKCDPEHVLVVHSRHGQGRTSIIIIALLLYQGVFQTVESAVFYFEHNRLPDDHAGASTQTLDSASQRRFLGYFAHRCQFKSDLHEKMVRPARLRRIIVQGLTNVNQIDVVCFWHPAQLAAAKRAKTQRNSFRRSTQSGTHGISSTHVFDDFADEEEMREHVLEMPEEAVSEVLKKVLEEGSFDSQLAGCASLAGTPFEFSSEGGSDEKVTTRTLEAASDSSQPTPPGVWEITDTELSGEFRIEIHRKMSVEQKEKAREKAEKSRSHGQDATPGWKEKLHGYISLVVVLVRLLPCFCCFRRAKRKKNPKFEGGMLFATWLHSGFLELDEPPQDSRQKPTKTVRVMLDRFGLDKATHAPPLRSQSTALQLLLEFEVHHRVEWKELNEMMHGKQKTALATGHDMSQSETLHWLTFVSEKIWPSFEKGFEKLVSDLLEPLKDSLPAPFNHIELEHFGLGPEFPKFGPINASSKDHEGLEVQLDIMLHYETNTNIVINLGLASIGISYLRISGLLCLRFKPIINELPVFTALQILFLNTPKIEIKFAKSLEIANLSMVHELIHSSIDKAIEDLMVLPNIININWADPESDSTVSFKNIMPSSVVRLGIVEGRDLHTEHSIVKRPPDTYCRMQLGAQNLQTRTIPKATNPVWSEEFDILVYDHRQTLGGTVYDVDFTGRSKVIGMIPPVPVGEIVAAGEEGRWIELANTPQNAHSTILLRAIHFDLHADRAKLHHHMGLSEVSIASMQSLIGEDSQGDGNGTPRLLAADDNGSMASIIRTVSEAFTKNSSATSPPPIVPRDSVTSEESIIDEDQVVTGFSCDNIIKVTERHAGAVALLICDIPGGHIPKELTEQRNLVEIRIHTDCAVKNGRKKVVQKCKEAQVADPGTITEKVAKSIERLADQGLKADDIAKALEEDEIEVHRIIRRRGWNIAFPQKICIFLHEGDLMNARTLEISLHLKRRTIAAGNVPLSRVLNHFSLKHNEIIKLRSPKGLTVDLDAEIRIYTLLHDEEKNHSSNCFENGRRRSHRGHEDQDDAKMCSI